MVQFVHAGNWINVQCIYSIVCLQLEFTIFTYIGRCMLNLSVLSGHPCLSSSYRGPYRGQTAGMFADTQGGNTGALLETKHIATADWSSCINTNSHRVQETNHHTRNGDDKHGNTNSHTRQVRCIRRQMDLYNYTSFLHLFFS